MEPKRHPKINVFLARFLEASGNIDGTGGKLRGRCGGAASRLRLSHFLQPTPQGGAILSKSIVQKQAKTDALPDLARLEPLARRIIRASPGGRLGR